MTCKAGWGPEAAGAAELDMTRAACLSSKVSHYEPPAAAQTHSHGLRI